LADTATPALDAPGTSSKPATSPDPAFERNTRRRGADRRPVRRYLK
jgi:hypothetical protein